MTPSPDVDLALSEIGEALHRGQLPKAMASAEAALAQGLSHPLFHRLRGVQAQQDGRLELAISDFETALQLSGEDAPVLNALGLCLARAGRPVDGLACLDRAIALEGNVAAFHFNRGWALEIQGRLDGAKAGYEAALTLDPNNVPALAYLAVLASRAADWPRAQDLAQKALAFDSASPSAALALARAEMAQGDTTGAEQRLRKVLDGRRADGHERAVTLAALGDALDELGRPAEAFTAYAQGADLLRGLYAPRLAGAETTTTYVNRLIEAFAKADPAIWRRVPRARKAGEPEGHVFLLGFARSGTTMLGQALAGHPNVVTLEERPTLTDSAQKFLFPADGPAALATASQDDLEAAREAYWRRVREAGAQVDAKILVDKLPMNTLGLPLIVKMFPQAKILFLRRDPRDVVLSCLRRQFVVEASTLDFLGLDSAARLYDATMTLMATYRSALDLDLREQGYETLVEDFEPQMREICAFIGMTFSPQMADFAGRSGDVATPSAVQLARGLNTEGVGVWRRYAEGLASVLPILTPWAKRFGYPAQ